MGGDSKPDKTKIKRLQFKDSSPLVKVNRSSRTKVSTDIALRRSQSRTCTLSTDRSRCKVNKRAKKNSRSSPRLLRPKPSVLKRNRSSTLYHTIAKRRSTLKRRHHINEKSSSKLHQRSIHAENSAKVRNPKRSCSHSNGLNKFSRPSHPSRSSNIVQSKLLKRLPPEVKIPPIQTVCPTPAMTRPLNNEMPRLKSSHAKNQPTFLSHASHLNDRTQRTKERWKSLRPDNAPLPAIPDIPSPPAEVQTVPPIQNDVEIASTRWSTGTGRTRNRKRQDADTPKSVADSKESSSRSYSHVSRSSVRDISLAFSVLAKPPCLMQSAVRPIAADSNGVSGTQHRNKYHDEWDNLEVWGLGRTSWRESLLTNSKQTIGTHPDFDARPGPKQTTEPVPQRSTRVKFSMYNTKAATNVIPRRKNPRMENRASTRLSQSTTLKTPTVPSTISH